MFEELLRVELLHWDNEGDGGEAEASAAAEKAAEAKNSAEKAAKEAAEKTFTQSEVNKFVSERNKNLKERFEQMEQSYQTLLDQQNLTKEQRDRLETDLEAVRNEMMTKEQRLEAEKKKSELKWQTELDAAKKEADEYKSLFETSTINREIQDAAIKHDGFQPSQFIAHLAPKSKMIDEVDAEGKTTGKKVPRVEWTTLDTETGQIQKTLVTPEEAVEKMKENVVEFGNLFKTNVAAGIGAGTAPGQASAAGQLDHSKISTEEYMKLAKTPEGRRQLGLSK